jgi:chromosome segregation ATPase
LTNISKFDDVLSSVSTERAQAIAKADAQREATIAMQKQNDEKLFKMEIEVERQRKESAKAATDLKTALVDNISSQNRKQDTQINNLQAQTTQLSSTVNNINVDNQRQDGEIQQATTVASDARQQANASAVKINDANSRVRNVKDTDSSKQAIDKIFPI